MLYCSIPDFITLLLFIPALLLFNRKLYPLEANVFFLAICCRLLFVFFFPTRIFQDVLISFHNGDNFHFVSMAMQINQQGNVNEATAFIKILAWFMQLGLTTMGLQEISIIGYILCCYLLLKIAGLLNLRKYFFIPLIAYSFAPHIFFITTLVLREPWEICSILTAMLALGNYLKNKKTRYLFIGGLSFLLGGILHVGIVLAGGIVLLFSFLLRHRGILFSLTTLLLLSFLLLYLGCLYAPYLIPKLIHYFNYSTNVEAAASGYSVYYSDTLLSSFLKIPFMLLNYLFFPFIWNIHDLNDLYACFFGILNFIFIFRSIKVIAHSYGQEKKIKVLFFFAWFIISVIYSIGTSNYGTALRHNSLSIWIIYMLGA